MDGSRPPGTFSIVACDSDRKFWGVAVATKPPSVGATVPWAEWRVGAIATQAYSNFWYGPRGLELLRKGLSAHDVVQKLTRPDPGRDKRQLGVVDRRGRSFAWTGSKCLETGMHQTGDGYACQGNRLASERVVPAMVSAFEASRGPLGRRMMSALQAGARAGGDKLGMESAAMLVVHRERWFSPAWSNYWVNLRVDLHPRPIQELNRLLRKDEAETRRFLAHRVALRKRW